MLVKFIKDAWLVLVSALVFGLLVASVHGLLIDRINNNAREKLRTQMKLMLSDATDFAAMPQDAEEPDYYIAKDESGNIVGYAIQASGGGFADNIGLLVSFSADLQTVRGISVLSSNETPGFGDKINVADFRDQFDGKPIRPALAVTKGGSAGTGEPTEIMGITGATISSQAVTDIVNAASQEIQQLVQH